MENVEFVRCNWNTINKLITAAKKENKIFTSCDNELSQYVVFGFDYVLEYGRDPTRFLRTNLNNCKFIIFDIPREGYRSCIRVKLLRDVIGFNIINLNDERRELIMKIDELLADKEYLKDQVNKLLDDLSDRDRYIDKLKGNLEWQKIMFDSIQGMYKSLLGESEEKSKGDN